jgi:aspartate carbamoyltransferase regulatory subunit
MAIKLSEIVCKYALIQMEEGEGVITCNNKKCKKYRDYCVATGYLKGSSWESYDTNLVKMFRCKHKLSSSVLKI